MSQGQIGYWLSQAISNAFIKRGKTPKVVTVVSQVVVDKNDPAFKDPTKPIGQFYSEKEALALSREKGWVVKEDAGRGYRRVVASPKPVDIVEKKSIVNLVEDGAIVIAAGGGGIPVYRTKVLRRIKGVDAVIDKALSDAGVGFSDILYGTPEQKALSKISAKEAEGYIKEGYFKAGSMLPKMEAATAFAKKNRIGIITDIENLEEALAGKAGTIILKKA